MSYSGSYLNLYWAGIQSFYRYPGIVVLGGGNAVGQEMKHNWHGFTIYSNSFRRYREVEKIRRWLQIGFGGKHIHPQFGLCFEGYLGLLAQANCRQSICITILAWIQKMIYKATRENLSCEQKLAEKTLCGICVGQFHRKFETNLLWSFRIVLG